MILSYRGKKFEDLNITIMGLGSLKGGVEVARFLAKMGSHLTITDLRNKEELQKSLEKLKEYPIKFVLGEHRKEDFQNKDFIVKNPGVPALSPYLKIAQENSIPIENDISLFLLFNKHPILAVTGTKGKSSTVDALYFIFKNYYQNSQKIIYLAGNSHISPLFYLTESFQKKEALFILELSSWQLGDLRFSYPYHQGKNYLKPKIATITNFFRDHQNTYACFQDYIKDKSEIALHQDESAFFIKNALDPHQKNLNFKAQTLYFFPHYDKKEIEKSIIDKNEIAYIQEEKAIFQKENKKIIFSLKEINVLKNQKINLFLAALMAFKNEIPFSYSQKILQNYQSQKNRLELVDIINNVKYYNDTTATIPEATLFSVENFPLRSILLICGGNDKDLDFSSWEKLFPFLKLVILLEGTAQAKIETVFEKTQLLKFKTKNMDEAVFFAKNFADKKDNILLSPGCTSFGLFKNEFERAQAFKKSVKKIKNA